MLIETMVRNAGRLFIQCVHRARQKLHGIIRWKQSNSLLIESPLAEASEYYRLWNKARECSYPTVDHYERDCEAAIETAWFHQLALLTQVVIKRSDLCYQHGRLLYATLVQYARKHVREHLNIVETSTARGFSAVCLAKAMHDAGATGKISTFDVLPHNVKILWNCVRDADGPRTRADLLQDYSALINRYVIFYQGDTKQELAKMTFQRVNLAFFDSVHSHEHVMAEFSSINGLQETGDIIFFDDYTPDLYPGVVKAADEICSTYGYGKNIMIANNQRRYLIAEKQ